MFYDNSVSCTSTTHCNCMIRNSSRQSTKTVRQRISALRYVTL